MQEKQERHGQFFLSMGLVLTFIVIAGFGAAAAVRPGGISTIPLLVHIHAAAFLGWFVLFCVQARLAGAGNIRTHMALGKASVALAAAMVVLGYLVVRGAYARPEFSIGGMSPAGSVMFPFTDIVNFVIAYGLALANRRTPDAHKRLMLLAGILIIDPAAARLVMTPGGPAPLILLLELALFAALFIYDIRSRRRPHWTSVLGLGLFVAAMIAKLTVAGTPAWAAFVGAVFG